jgi:C4-dicarboxylate transporter DctM subunit
LIMLAVMLLGMFLDGISITLLIVPTIYPLIVSLGFNPVWFAVLLTVNFELATMTPPVGMNLYIVHGVTKIPMAEVIRGSFPFMILLIIGLIIFAFVPQLSLWLPSVMK